MGVGRGGKVYAQRVLIHLPVGCVTKGSVTVGSVSMGCVTVGSVTVGCVTVSILPNPSKASVSSPQKGKG